MTEAAEAAAFGPTFVKPCPLLGADSVLVCVSQLPTAIRRCPAALAAWSLASTRASTQNDYEHEGVSCCCQHKRPEASSASLRQFDHQGVHNYSAADEPCDPG